MYTDHEVSFPGSSQILHIFLHTHYHAVILKQKQTQLQQAKNSETKKLNKKNLYIQKLILGFILYAPTTPVHGSCLGMLLIFSGDIIGENQLSLCKPGNTCR